jgi:hypothetical protein
MARGGHGLCKVSLGPAMTDPVGGPYRWAACARLLTFWTHHGLRLRITVPASEGDEASVGQKLGARATVRQTMFRHNITN